MVPRKRRNVEQEEVVVEEEEMTLEMPSSASGGPQPHLETVSTEVIEEKKGLARLPSSFKWNPLINIEVNKQWGIVTRHLTDCHTSDDMVLFSDKKEVSEFLTKYKDSRGDSVPSVSIVYSSDGWNYREEAGIIIYPILKLWGTQISCLILDCNLYQLGESYDLRAILTTVPNLMFLSIKSQGNDSDNQRNDNGEFPVLEKLVGVELVANYYCGLGQKILEEYGRQLKRVGIQDMDKQKAYLSPTHENTLKKMLDRLNGGEGMFGNLEELQICSLRNLSVLSSLAVVKGSVWNLKRLAVNVTEPNRQGNFSHWQILLNRLSESLEEVHLDAFGCHNFVEDFYEWRGTEGDPEGVLTRKVCEKVRVMSVPSLVLVRYQEFGEILRKYFPGVEELRFLRWERKWPMKLREYKGRPQKRDLGKVLKEVRKGVEKLAVVKVLKGGSMETEEDVMFEKSFKVVEIGSQSEDAKDKGEKRFKTN